METEALGPMSPALRRRGFLLASVAAAWPLARASEADNAALAAAWQSGAQQQLGLLTAQHGRLEPGATLLLPTRAHGVLVEPDGSLLAFARRPGDWLLRWHPMTGRARWRWLEDDTRLNGHGAPVGERLIVTTETNRETGLGCLGVRERETLELIDAWSTQGRDPHQVLVLPQALGSLPAGTLMVANGGVTTRPETGRSKMFGERLDASLVALSPSNGSLLGQWRLDDPYLSIRHLAWNPQSRTLGVALQAEHASEAERHVAPVLAVWDGERLNPARNQPPLGGYGGDIIALPRGFTNGFAMACTRGDTLAFFAADSCFVRAATHAQSCALACAGSSWWNAGRDSVFSEGQPSMMGTSSASRRLPVAPDLRMDNHWQLYS